MPRPPELERDVQFWIRVYTEIDTNAGFLHDQYNLGVVYETLHFGPNTSAARARAHRSTAARVRIIAALKRIAACQPDPCLPKTSASATCGATTARRRDC